MSTQSWHQPTTPKPLRGTAPLPQRDPPRGGRTPAGAVPCRRGRAEGRGYSHMPPMSPAILQSHLYHQVMPSSAEAAAASGAAAAAAGNCSSCELISPQLLGARRPTAHLSPRCHLLLGPARGTAPKARPGPVAVWPCRARPPQG